MKFPPFQTLLADMGSIISLNSAAVNATTAQIGYGISGLSGTGYQIDEIHLFGNGIDHKGSVGHTGQGRRADMPVIAVKDVLVDFIGDEKKVVLLAQVGDEGEFLR